MKKDDECDDDIERRLLLERSVWYNNSNSRKIKWPIFKQNNNE